MKTTFCQSCGAPIVFVKTLKGKSMPCNANMVYYISSSKGTKTIVTPNGEIQRCEYTDGPNLATGTGYVPHWATCPNASRFKRK